MTKYSPLSQQYTLLWVDSMLNRSQTKRWCWRTKNLHLTDLLIKPARANPATAAKTFSDPKHVPGRPRDYWSRQCCLKNVSIMRNSPSFSDDTNRKLLLQQSDSRARDRHAARPVIITQPYSGEKCNTAAAQYITQEEASKKKGDYSAPLVD